MYGKGRKRDELVPCSQWPVVAAGMARRRHLRRVVAVVVMAGLLVRSAWWKTNGYSYL